MIRVAGPGGNYLKEKHTLKHLRKEHIFPSGVIDRLSLDVWIDKGSKESKDMAKARVDSLLRTHEPDLLHADLQESMDSIMRDVMSKHGLEDSVHSLLT